MKTINLTNESALLTDGQVQETMIEIRKNAREILKKFGATQGLIAKSGKVWMLPPNATTLITYIDPETNKLCNYEKMVAEHGTLELISV